MSATASIECVSVVCAGTVVADLFVPPLPRLPAAGELLASGDFLFDAGGCAVNTAICLTKLDVQASVVGKVGEDVFGRFVEQDLRHKGIDTAGLRRSTTYGTSKTIILPVVGEDRRFIHTFGANADFSAEDIDRSRVSQAEVFYLGGYLILPRLRQSELAELLCFAQQQGVRTVLDIAVPAGDVGLSLTALADVLPYVDVFMPNDQEAQALTGETEPRRQAERFLQLGCGTAIITMGAEGTLLMDTVQTLQAPAFPVEVVDASGAGDAFAAGFIVGLLEEWSVPESLRFASAIGASACTQLGCTTGVFTRSLANAYLQTHPLTIQEITSSSQPGY